MTIFPRQDENGEGQAVDRLISDLGITLPQVPSLAEEIDAEFPTTDSDLLDAISAVKAQSW